MRALFRAADEPWAITQSALETIVSIAQRENESPQAVAAKLGRELQNTYSAEERDGVAILPVTGPLFRYANLFTQISGATSYDMLAQDLTAAVENPAIKAIILNIDSPGGEVNGCSELAKMISAASGTKPIVAYIGGTGASGAYWIASACDEIVCADTSIIGSIGVVAVYPVKGSGDKPSVEIVSTQSPNKRLDASTDDGRARIQKRIDSLAAVFVETVADNRGLSVEKVLADFGQGDVMIGAEAVAAGMADRIGTFESVLAEYAGKSKATQSGGFFIGASDEATASEEQSMTEIVEKTVEAAAETEKPAAPAVDQKARISAILKSDEAQGRGDLANHLAFDTDLTVEAATAILKAAPKAEAPKAAANPLAAAMAKVPNPDVGSEAEAAADGDVKSFILAAAKAAGVIGN